MTVTLQEIKAEHSRLATLIESFERQVADEVKVFVVDEATIELAGGERYAGLVLDTDGAPSHHLVLLPGEATDIAWVDAVAWAEEAGGKLPNRQEQALLYANLKGEFQPAWYWSCEAHATDGSYAWLQYFGYGGQSSYGKSYEGRARAVRRFPA